MRLSGFVLFTVILVAPMAKAAEAGLPATVAARIENDKKACDGPASLETGFVTRRDVNGDGIPDYILDYAHLKCGPLPGFCGSGGCTMVVFASRKGRFVKVIDDLVGRIDFKMIKGRPAAVMVYPGSFCGKDPCLDIRIWNGATFKSKP